MSCVECSPSALLSSASAHLALGAVSQPSAPFAHSFPVYAEDIDAGDSASAKALADVAMATGVTLVGGSIAERSNGKLYNTCCVFSKEGKLLAKHRCVFACACTGWAQVKGGWAAKHRGQVGQGSLPLEFGSNLAPWGVWCSAPLLSYCTLLLASIKLTVSFKDNHEPRRQVVITNHVMRSTCSASPPRPCKVCYWRRCTWIGLSTLCCGVHACSHFP